MDSDRKREKVFYRNFDLCSEDKVSFCMETGMTFWEGIGKLGLKGTGVVQAGEGLSENAS